jgi:hypothetical protein
MSMTEKHRTTSGRQLDLTARIPVSATPGDRVECEWLLANRSREDALVGFYLHVSASSITQLACSAGVARRGRFNGNASLSIPAGKTVWVSATLRPCEVGDDEVRVVAVTRDETIERADTVAVAAPFRGAENNRPLAFVVQV